MAKIVLDMPITFVTAGIESAGAQSKAAAGDRKVLAHGAATADAPGVAHVRYRVCPKA